jgi:S1-C subfamily serine protease
MTLRKSSQEQPRAAKSSQEQAGAAGRELVAFAGDEGRVKRLTTGPVTAEPKRPSMTELTEWKVPASAQPRAEDYGYDLERALSAMVGLHALIPADAFTAQTLGTERAGNGVSIGGGLVLTVGYLITEAETIWLHLHDGQVVPGHALAVDAETGFGLVQALVRIDLPSLPLGSSTKAEVGERVVLGGAGGRTRSVAARIAAKQEFAGYWEYVLDEAIFTFPAHPNWGGTGLISSAGDLIGIGSLQLERERAGKNENLNMVIPIDLFKPIRDDLVKSGRANRPLRPWLGLYSTEIEDKVIVVGLAGKGPAARAEIKTGDVIVAVKGEKIATLAQFYRKVWSLGPAGVEIPLTLYRDGVTFDVRVNSSDRTKFLKAPKLH